MPAVRPLLWMLPFAVIVPLAGCSVATREAGISATLDMQAAAWNRGDIEGFLSHYWRSPQLTFTVAGRTVRGYSAIAERYRTRYPDAARMGRLMFSELEVRDLGPQAALVLGRWRVDASGETSAGRFSLVVQQFDGAWRITHDHTSVDEPAAHGSQSHAPASS